MRRRGARCMSRVEVCASVHVRVCLQGGVAECLCAEGGAVYVEGVCS